VTRGYPGGWPIAHAIAVCIACPSPTLLLFGDLPQWYAARDQPGSIRAPGVIYLPRSLQRTAARIRDLCLHRAAAQAAALASVR
jgi:hypothetical protein